MTPSSPSVLDLLRKGDPLAWESFVRRHQARVYGLALHYTALPEDARDLTQEVFIRVYQNLALLPEEESWLAWLLRVTRNVCIDHLRRRKARPPLWDVPVAELVHLSSPELSPEEAQLERARATMVHRALQDLTELNREILLLKEIQGLKVEDIAEILGIPEGTVKSRSNRARLELAEKLAAAEQGG